MRGFLVSGCIAAVPVSKCTSLTSFVIVVSYRCLMFLPERERPLYRSSSRSPSLYLDGRRRMLWITFPFHGCHDDSIITKSRTRNSSWTAASSAFVPVISYYYRNKKTLLLTTTSTFVVVFSEQEEAGLLLVLIHPVRWEEDTRRGRRSSFRGESIVPAADDGADSGPTRSRFVGSSTILWIHTRTWRRQHPTRSTFVFLSISGATHYSTCS
jgi:hypothetical protein